MKHFDNLILNVRLDFHNLGPRVRSKQKKTEISIRLAQSWLIFRLSLKDKKNDAKIPKNQRELEISLNFPRRENFREENFVRRRCSSFVSASRTIWPKR